MHLRGLRGVVVLAAVGAALAVATGHARLPAQQPTAAGADPDDEYELLLRGAQAKLRKGNLSAAAAQFDELLQAAEEEPAGQRPSDAQVAAAQLGRFTIELRRGNYEQVRDGIGGLPVAMVQQREFALLRARALLAIGAHDRAIGLLRERVAKAADDHEARFLLGEALHADGQRNAARAEWQAAVARPAPDAALPLAYQERCRWRLGGRDNIELASRGLVRALQLAPDCAEARITLGILNFEAYGEARGYPSGEQNLNRVLDEHGDLEEALLALYRLRSSNFQLDGGKTERLLDRLLAVNPRCVPAIVLRGAGVLDDRRYQDAAAILDDALRIDANHRTALAHRAAAAFLQHDEDAYRRYRARALAGDPGWPEPDTVLGDHLVALYRFADAIPFYEAALQAAPGHVPAMHGLAKARIYNGEGAAAKALLLEARALEPGLVHPWRNNAIAVQQLLDDEYVPVANESFALQFHRDDVEVLREYLMPVHLQALEVLGKKYQHRPARQVQVEVFHTWDDFSVRTIGFRGFTALGACFGPFITLVSPGDADLRQQDFMWEATAWHEYTHVLTLGLSKHRVPRWLTEGFSVYEEKVRDPAWERGMDRELFDAFHNRDIPPVRLLNRLFRGPRILFGYYQGGLIVELIARDHGFAKAIELLKAFGDDLDTEAAFARALGIASTEFDAQFLQFVQRDKLRGMRLVPRWDDAALQRLLQRAQQDQGNLQVRVDLAWACLQRDNPVDTGRWLAEVLRSDPEHGPALLVRAELLRRRKDLDGAVDCWRRGFARGADDFDSRIACGRVLLELGDRKGAEDQWQRAKACWPGCTDQATAPELLLARLYREGDDAERAQMEMKSYCQRTARAFQPRYTLAGFERDAGHRDVELRYLVECNRIDPFHRELHQRLGDAYVALGRKREAAIEYEVAAAVPPQLDRRYTRRGAEAPAADAPEELAERGQCWLSAARLHRELGADGRALELLDRVEREAKATAAAAEAARLREQWR